MTKVDILLATYNGEQFVAEQIDSILQQTYKDIHLFIRDDGSQDSTKAIIQSKQKQYPHKITIIPNHSRLGVVGNFSTLLEFSESFYVMFSDQDDVWLSNKVE